MSLSVFSRFSAGRSSLVKLLSGKEADCKVKDNIRSRIASTLQSASLHPLPGHKRDTKTTDVRIQSSNLVKHLSCGVFQQASEQIKASPMGHS